MKISFYIILISLFLISCTKKNEGVVCSGASFIFLNENGEDLFNKNTLNHLELAELEIFNSEGNQIPVYSFTLNEKINLQFGLFGADNPGINSTTYIKFGDITVDTINTKFIEIENSLFINELFYNGILLENNINVTSCGTQTHEIIIFKE